MEKETAIHYVLSGMATMIEEFEEVYISIKSADDNAEIDIKLKYKNKGATNEDTGKPDE